jgi:hypothetical protein
MKQKEPGRLGDGCGWVASGSSPFEMLVMVFQIRCTAHTQERNHVDDDDDDEQCQVLFITSLTAYHRTYVTDSFF